MPAGCHRVRRQRWSVRAGAEDQAFAIHRWLREHWESELQAVFESAFNLIAPGDEVVRVGRLEVDVRVHDLDELLEVLPARLARALLEQGAPASQVETTSNMSAAAGDVGEEALVHYLLTGSVLWPIRPDEQSFVRDLERMAAAAPERLAARLVACIFDPRPLAHAVFRLLQLLTEDHWPTVLQIVSRDIGAGMVRVPIEPLPSGPTLAGSSDRKLRLVVSRMLERNSPSSAFNTADTAVVEFAATSSEDESRSGVERSKVRSSAAASQDSDELRESSRGDEDPLNHWRDATRVSASIVEHDRTFPLAVANAGLVLLHPFLSRYIESAGLTLRRSIEPDSPSAARAVALLHFLATGRDEVLEFEVGLIKVLLGFRPETPLPVGGGLVTDSDRDEAHALIEAAIGHWGAIKRTSIEGVRASFLQRPGLLKEDDNGWRLCVNSGPFDVLLKRLPWSVGVVRLPWMTTPIHCEWPTA